MTSDPSNHPSPSGRGYGKLAFAFLLGVVGALAFQWQGAIVGLIVGLALGHSLDVQLERTASGDLDLPVPTAAYEIDAEAQRLFSREIAQAFAALLAVAPGARDPKATESALWRFLRDRLGFSELDLNAASQSLAEAVASGSSLPVACARCAKVLPEAEHRLLASALYELARDIGLAAGPARLVMRDAAAALGLSEDEEGSLRAFAFGGGDQSHDYTILGVPEAASDTDVRRAFRALAGKLHPDKVSHLGPKAMEMATREFQEVRTAYERVKAARGF